MNLEDSGSRQFLMSKIKILANSNWFNQLSMFFIILGAVVVGIETSPALTLEYAGYLKAIDSFVLWFFTFEVIVRMLACSPQFKDYFRDGWNIFDLLIVIICHGLTGSPFLNVLRLLRVLRTLRMIRSVPRLRIIVEGLMRGMSSMSYVSILLGLVFYIFGVCGVFLFRDISPTHFGDLGSAVFTLFQVVTLEGWVEILEPIENVRPILAKVYFVTFIILGTMIFLNLFIGAIVGGMAEAEADALKSEEKDIAVNLARINREIYEIKNILRQKS